MRFKYLLLVFLAMGLFACAMHQEARWKTVPEADIPYEKAWLIVVSSISEQFSDLETIDGQSGYLRSAWKVTDTCWAGIAFGGFIPCKQTRVVVRVEERNPFKVKIKIEKQEMNIITGIWSLKGNDEIMEKEIMEGLSGRLRRF